MEKSLDRTSDCGVKSDSYDEEVEDDDDDVEDDDDDDAEDKESLEEIDVGEELIGKWESQFGI